MTILSNYIMISYDLEQKQSFKVGSGKLYIVPNRHQYDQDGKSTNPVIALVEIAGEKTPYKHGDGILLSHNCIFDKAYQVNEYSIIPNDRWILATVDEDGGLIPSSQHIICKRVPMIETVKEYLLPDTARRFYEDRVEVILGEPYEQGDVLGILKWADYEVTYNWNGEERRRIVVYKNDVLCKIQEYEPV